MKTISQVAKITGISTRTLQYYDEIDLLKPSKTTDSGYRLYDDEALEKLQQILFFKELGFQLKEIKEILEKPDFDKIKAFKKQKELLYLRRNRTDRLISLLDRLEKGETCMSFKEFDLSEYIEALEDFKSNQTEEIIKHWGSIENFDMFIQKIRDDEERVARSAIQEFGSIENYTKAVKYNLEHFSEIMEGKLSQIPEEMKNEDKFLKLASHKGEDVASDSIQNMVKEIIAYARGSSVSEFIEDDEHFCNIIIGTYSNDYLKKIFDTKYGEGSCDYIVEAFRCYSKNKCS
ncbi:MAG: MerR family transcriptional regulator [Lachnospiraceae bacterium]|nr:MerR family transcriptional regulator [Lachnospiraceae bacterium]